VGENFGDEESVCPEMRGGGRLADFIALLAGQIGRHFEDTEQGAVFFEGFARSAQAKS
jgi:hypothetical protein